MSRIAEKLAALFLEEKGLKVAPKIYRVYAGRIQRANGAWSWQMGGDVFGGASLGSIFTARECADAPERAYCKERFGSAIYEVYPVPEPKRRRS